LERGARLVELLKQGLHEPMPVEEQVISIYAGTNGYVDDIPVGDVRRFESELLDYFRTRRVDILSKIRDTKEFPEGDEVAHAIADFKRTIQPSSGEIVVPETDPGSPVGPAQSKETLETE